MPSVREFSETVQGLIDQLTILTASITKSYNNLNTRSSATSGGSPDIKTQATIDLLNEEAATYDRKFEEAQYKFQASGGKSRKQTLQEFVIFFFFVAYALFTVSLILYAQAAGISTAKIFGGMLFLMFIIAGIIIRYA
jgi:lipopolysaccharide export LptBFGC system permease protein LptF